MAPYYGPSSLPLQNCSFVLHADDACFHFQRKVIQELLEESKSAV